MKHLKQFEAFNFFREREDKNITEEIYTQLCEIDKEFQNLKDVDFNQYQIIQHNSGLKYFIKLKSYTISATKDYTDGIVGVYVNTKYIICLNDLELECSNKIGKKIYKLLESFYNKLEELKKDDLRQNFKTDNLMSNL